MSEKPEQNENENECAAAERADCEIIAAITEETYRELSDNRGDDDDEQQPVSELGEDKPVQDCAAQQTCE